MAPLSTVCSLMAPCGIGEFSNFWLKFKNGVKSERHIVNESRPKVLFDTIPIIRLVPTPQNEINRENTYACPVYKTSERKGTLSTTGHSTNFVLWIDFPSNREQRHWINRGVAALCSLDD